MPDLMHQNCTKQRIFIDVMFLATPDLDATKKTYPLDPNEPFDVATAIPNASEWFHNRRAVMRIKMIERKIEQVSPIDFHQTGYYGFWLGLTPEDSPVILKDTGTQEIIALDWHAP